MAKSLRKRLAETRYELTMARAKVITQGAMIAKLRAKRGKGLPFQGVVGQDAIEARFMKGGKR